MTAVLCTRVVLELFGVVALFRMRRVCRAFRTWCTAKLASMPRLVAVGGRVTDCTIKSPRPKRTAGVEVLDLSTLRWSKGSVPCLPAPRGSHSACGGNGRIVVVGGLIGAVGAGADAVSTAVHWRRGSASWSVLPSLNKARNGAAAVALRDGRTMVIGGWDPREERPQKSVETLAADGKLWTVMQPMASDREGPAAAALPDGKVLVAGGRAPSADGDAAVKTAELWEPTTGEWTAAPPMAHSRCFAGCCVLPSGKVAVVGGKGSDGERRSDGEIFDPEARQWQPLPPMAYTRGVPDAVAVAGGLLALGSTEDSAPNELFDEESNRWFALPHPMVEPRKGSARVVPMPAQALAPPPAAPPAAGAAGIAGGAARAAAAAASGAVGCAAGSGLEKADKPKCRSGAASPRPA